MVVMADMEDLLMPNLSLTEVMVAMVVIMVVIMVVMEVTMEAMVVTITGNWVDENVDCQNSYNLAVLPFLKRRSSQKFTKINTAL